MQPLLHINWNYTYRCTLDCAHCYSRAFAHLDELDREGKIACAHNIVDSHVFSVNLGGGEPALCSELEEVVRVLSDGGVRVAMSTSGWRMAQERLAQLAEAARQRLHLIQF